MFNEIKSLQGAPLHTISSCVSSVRRRYDIYIYNTSIIRLLCSYYEFSLGHWPWSPHTGRSLYLTHTYIYIFITYTAIVGTILYYYYYYAYEYNNILVYTSTQCDGVGFYFPISPRAHTHTRAPPVYDDHALFFFEKHNDGRREDFQVSLVGTRISAAILYVCVCSISKYTPGAPPRDAFRRWCLFFAVSHSSYSFIRA